MKYEKLTKILPKGKCFRIFKENWPIPLIFQNLQKRGKINDSEMFKTFNMGIGLVLVVAKRDAVKIKQNLKKRKIRHYEIGYVVNDSKRKIIL